MFLLSCAIALALGVAPIPRAFAAPPPCQASGWGWPGFEMGSNPWGAVMYPSDSSVHGAGKADACFSSSAAHSSTASLTSFSTTFKSVYTTTSVFSQASGTTFQSTQTYSVPITSSTIVKPSTSTQVPGSTASSTPASQSSSSALPSTTSPSSKPTSSPSSSSSAAPTSTQPTSGSNGSSVSGTDVQAYLSAHNNIRAQRGAPALSWNNTLAAAAQKWVDDCVFKHSGGSVGPFGENLAAGSGDYSITSAVSSWTNEASQYNLNNPTASHFTQVVWKGSTQLGCAVKSCAAGTVFDASFGDSSFFVCEYFPQGNVIGAFAANVQA